MTCVVFLWFSVMCGVLCLFYGFQSHVFFDCHTQGSGFYDISLHMVVFCSMYLTSSHFNGFFGKTCDMLGLYNHQLMPYELDGVP